MTKEKLPIHKQFLVISSPVEFSLIANNGTDKVLRPAGVWQLDCYKLLPEKFMKNYPVFNLELEYDETKIPDGFAMEYYFTNINLGDSLKGVSGDLVELSDFQFETIKNMLSFSEKYPFYKSLAQFTVKDILSDYGSSDIVLTIPTILSKVLYIGCCITLKDGEEISCSPFPIFIDQSEPVVGGSISFKYKVGINFLLGLSVSVNIVECDLFKYSEGLYPSSTKISSDSSKTFVFKVNTVDSDSSNFDKIDFFVLS